MQPKMIYLLLCLAGVILPYRKFVPWVLEHGLNMRLFFQELFINRIGGFFAMDVFVSAVVLVVFLNVEKSRQPIRLPWLPALALISVGVSLALPLFLYLREEALQMKQEYR